jgi:hypothetical protein
MSKRLYVPRGYKFPPGAKAIDRRSDWGNSHKVGTHGVPDRATAVNLYERDLLAGTLKGFQERPMTHDNRCQARTARL